jgi:hypothetical protein
MQAYVILRPPPGGRRISTSTRLPSHPLIAAPLAATLPPELSATATPSPQLSATATPSPKSVIPEGDLLFLDFGTFAAPPTDQHPQPPPLPPELPATAATPPQGLSSPKGICFFLLLAFAFRPALLPIVPVLWRRPFLLFSSAACTLTRTQCRPSSAEFPSRSNTSLTSPTIQTVYKI